MQQLDQSQFIFSEIKEKPFMRVYPSSNKMFYYSKNLTKEEIIPKGSKLLLKPCFPNEFIPNPHYRIYIASVGV